ncbi:MAG TPA: hypothetical protein VGW38_27595 [Chloroflexota bacterium]|nr:hypothetical protein [Chloroflexota bacterium]
MAEQPPPRQRRRQSANKAEEARHSQTNAPAREETAQPVGRRSRSTPSELGGGEPDLPQSVPPGVTTPGGKEREEQREGFTPLILDKTVIAIPLLKRLEDERKRRQADPHLPPGRYSVVIDLNLEYGGGRAKARERVREFIPEAIAHADQREKTPASGQGISEAKTVVSEQYVLPPFQERLFRIWYGSIVARDHQRPRWKRTQRRRYLHWQSAPAARSIVSGPISRLKHSLPNR